MSWMHLRFAVAIVGYCALSASTSAQPIPVTSYTYQNPTEWALHWSSDPGEDGQTVKRLTDGVVGPWSFTNLATVGYQHNPPGTSETAIPMVDLNLGGTHQVRSVEVNYIIDHASFIFAPQTYMEILGSTDGTNFSRIGFKNDFPTVEQSQAAMTTGIQSVVFDFGPGGTTASHIRVDTRTWATFMFLSEITVNAVPEPAATTLIGMGVLSLPAFRRRVAAPLLG